MSHRVDRKWMAAFLQILRKNVRWLLPKKRDACS